MAYLFLCAVLKGNIALGNATSLPLMVDFLFDFSKKYQKKFACVAASHKAIDGCVCRRLPCGF